MQNLSVNYSVAIKICAEMKLPQNSATSFGYKHIFISGMFMHLEDIYLQDTDCFSST